MIPFHSTTAAVYQQVSDHSQRIGEAGIDDFLVESFRRFGADFTYWLVGFAESDESKPISTMPIRAIAPWIWARVPEDVKIAVRAHLAARGA